jgi:hypothetical protein
VAKANWDPVSTCCGGIAIGGGGERCSQAASSATTPSNAAVGIRLRAMLCLLLKVRVIFRSRSMDAPNMAQKGTAGIPIG